jgi:hypothetical protein
LLKRLLPIAKIATGLIPGVGPIVSGGLTVADKLLTRKGVAGYGGLGALYQAPDGTLYQVQGPAEEELGGLYDAEELDGLYDAEELDGLTEDETLDGLTEDEELGRLAQEEELQGLAANEDLEGLGQGYIREDTGRGLQAYVPERPPQTRWFTPPSQPPEFWKPLW